MNKEVCRELAEKYAEEGLWIKKTHTDYLHEQVIKNGEKTAIIDRERSITFRELEDRANRLAAYFSKDGLKKGDRVVLQHVNTISFAEICFAFFRLGVIPVLAMPAHREREVSAIIETSGAKGYIVVRSYHGYEYSELAEKMRKKYEGLKYFWFVDEIEELDIESYGEEDIPKPEAHFDDIAILVLSGGTTGIPKLIPRIHASFLHEQQGCAEMFGVKEGSRVLVAMPLAHAWNLCGPGLFGSLLSGAEVVLGYDGTSDEILDLIQKYKITNAGLVPSLIMSCMQIMDFCGDFDLSSLKNMQVGGSMTTQKFLEEAVEHFGGIIQQAYGMSEGLVCGTEKGIEMQKLLTCHGKPVCEGDKIVILDENDEVMPDGAIGQIATRGPSVFMGYFNNPTADQRSFTDDGFYKTGDKGRIDPDTGELQVLGRVAEQINRMGEKVMPSELEDYLMECSWIKEAYVVPAEDKELIQRICIFAKVNDHSADLKEIRTYLRSKGIAEFKLPDQFEIVNEFPYTAVGKIDRKKLSEIANIRG
ncbi:2,3-dihydroxybenzoate-AMP ligase/yersiniabactin salicyl-AMP ligase [Lachnospiraceae bacterium KH1T2]|nr:2,3-dihydroxybenzoate-AMP ligase/yersiniabactin salicyl-AMP ligase [Lachnospiraceae bacterium KH1T2]